MSVTDVLPMGGIREDELLAIAYSLESKSEHPVAKAIVSYAEEKGIALHDTIDFAAVSGNGLKAKIDGVMYFGGSVKYIFGKIARSSGQNRERHQSCLQKKSR